MAKPKAPTGRQRDIIAAHRTGKVQQNEAMRQLKLGRDYHAFYRLFYRCTIMDDVAHTNV